MKRMSEAGYNERLFGGGVRQRLHLARFEWMRGALQRAGANCRSVVELGCFDGRAIGFLPHPPHRYVGLDANWEKGLAAAKDKYRGDQRFEFHECKTPASFRGAVGSRRFHTAICLETLEHVPPESVEDYIRAMAEVTMGHIVVTVPNEKGLVFLSKYVAKRAFADAQSYRASEIVAATLGRMDSVERDEHKGFDYEAIVETIGTFFEVTEVSGFPFSKLPRSAGFGVGVLARARNRGNLAELHDAPGAVSPRT
jgi:hypothetical protein